jgi:hypothetical protein
METRCRIEAFGSGEKVGRIVAIVLAASIAAVSGRGAVPADGKTATVRQLQLDSSYAASSTQSARERELAALASEICSTATTGTKAGSDIAGSRESTHAGVAAMIGLAVQLLGAGGLWYLVHRKRMERRRQAAS